VRTAAGGRAALAALEEGSVDVIVQRGVTEFVTKPLNCRDLLARMRARLHQRKLAGARSTRSSNAPLPEFVFPQLRSIEPESFSVHTPHGNGIH
jgi:DNA-binding response OmpR family regulator